MCSRQDNKTLLSRNQKGCRCFSIVLFLVLVLLTSWPVLAQNASQNLQIKYQDDLLTISVTNTDIKEFFRELANEADIYIEYPSAMEKNITFDRKDVSLNDFLTSFLRNMNYTLIFSDSGAGGKKIKEVYIYQNSTWGGASVSDSARERIVKQIASYQEKIETAKEKLQEVGEDSSRGKAYQRRITRYEKRIETLEKKL